MQGLVEFTVYFESMSFQILRRAAQIEVDDNFHISRLILLVGICKSGPSKSIEGLTKLAKLDFLLRYPNCLERALRAAGEDDALELEMHEMNSIESQMIRYRYGPWDKRYRRWLGMMAAKNLVELSKGGRTIFIRPTEVGIAIAKQITALPEFSALVSRGTIISKRFAKFSGTKLKDFMYQTFPELLSLKWGENISI